MACLKISQKSGLGTVKEIITFVRNFDIDITDIKVSKSGMVTFFADRFDNLSDELKWRTRGVKYDPSNGRYWLPKKTVKKVFTLPRWEKV